MSFNNNSGGYMDNSYDNSSNNTGGTGYTKVRHLQPGHFQVVDDLLNVACRNLLASKPSDH